MSDKKGDESMKKYLASVCVCAVLFSVGIHGGGMREVSAKASGSYENLAILQDIIRENECQAGMAFLGYTYEGAETAEILEYTRQGEVAAAYLFYRMERWLMQGDMKFMPLSRGMIAGSVFIRLILRKKGNIWMI